MSAHRSSMVDWDLAVLTASKLSGPGPVVSRAEAQATVDELRAGAHRSTPLVRQYTGLVAEQRTAPILVVDRAGWIQANVDGFATVISPLVERVRERRGDPSPVAEAIGSRVTGLEVGGLLGFMSTKVLGQFDPFFAAPELPVGTGTADGAANGSAGRSPGAGSQPAERAGQDVTTAPDGGVAPPTTTLQPSLGNGAAGQGPVGRLLLVAPNIVHVEQELDVDPADFRLWVCLHEETHRVQFTAVPWMRDHIHREIGSLLGSVEVDPAKVAAMLGDGVRRVGELLRGNDEVSLIDLVQTPEQKEILDRITAVMSLLEGHADVVMDGVGPEVIPSVSEIRRKFNKRRRHASGFDRVIRRLMGFDAKMAQYRNGAIFVRGAIDQVGMEGFNAVWAGPQNLPSRAEIGDPESWVRRVHG